MSKENPLVTIGLTTYNRADGYLRCALDAAVSQTYNNIEIIVSDNNSEDNTEEVVKSYSDQRINYIKQKENIGAGGNFNFCLDQAQGKYFLLLHDDDSIDPDFIETCMEMISTYGDTGIVRTGTRLIDSEGSVKSIKPNYSGSSNADFLLSWFSNKTALYLCSTLYNTKGLKEVGGFTSETHLFDDVAPMLKLTEKYGKLDVSHVKAGFRRHGENRGSSEEVENWVRDSVYLLDIIKNMDLERSEYVMKRAQIFFSRKCYRYVKAIPSPVQQLAAYKMVYRKFGYRFSPLRYHCSKIKLRMRLSSSRNKISRMNRRTRKKIATASGLSSMELKIIRRNKKKKNKDKRDRDLPKDVTQNGKEKLRIAFFVGSFPLISETFILNQITGLIDRGHTVDIFASRYVSDVKFHGSIDKYDLMRKTHFLNLPNRPLHRLFRFFNLLFFSDGWKRPKVIARTLDYRRYGRSALTLSLACTAILFFKKKPYDILHCQFGSSGPQVLSLKKVKAVTGKLVISFRGVDLTGSLINKPDRYKNVYKHADYFFPVSKSFRQKLIVDGCDQDKIKVHHSGIDCSRFEFMERSRKDGDITSIVTIGRLVEKKGIAYAIRAIALTVASGRRIKYTIIGDGVLRGDLQSLIRLLRLDNYVTLVGSKTSDEVIDHLAKAHIFLAPSVTSKSGDSEGIPNTLKEAMAMGIPVISTFHSGIPELIEDKKSGFLVPERDVNALAKRLEFLIDNPGTWPEIGRASRKVIESKFEINKLNDELIDTYKQLIGRKSYDSKNKESNVLNGNKQENNLFDLDHLILKKNPQ
ncbi:MAG: glycosyltransferase [Balneolales bacterium]